MMHLQELKMQMRDEIMVSYNNNRIKSWLNGKPPDNAELFFKSDS